MHITKHFVCHRFRIVTECCIFIDVIKHHHRLCRFVSFPFTGNNREFGYRELPVDTPPDDRITASVTMSNGGTGANATDKTTTSPQGPNSSSPKLRLKFHKFWGANNKFSRTTDDAAAGGLPGAPVSNPQAAGVGCTDFTGDERQKRRGFAHYDVQSLTATVGLPSRLQNMLSRRRNTATGASAASMLAARSSTPESGDEDLGDGKHNNLLDRYTRMKSNKICFKRCTTFSLLLLSVAPNTTI